MTTLDNMTLEDLRRYIDDRISHQLAEHFGKREAASSWQQVRDVVSKHRWTPPPGAKSSLDLLRQDRDG